MISEMLYDELKKVIPLIPQKKAPNQLFLKNKISWQNFIQMGDNETSKIYRDGYKTNFVVKQGYKVKLTLYPYATTK